ncbi:MAG TPA: ATP-binding protein [Spirochaetales bacterium]|nr:ATP-binding protein [Spirochaetales bacterium]
MTLRRKILAGYGLACLLLALVVAWAIANLVALGKATASILRENYRSILAADGMAGALDRLDSGALLVLAGDPDGGQARFREGEALFFSWLARAEDNITIEGEAELVRAIRSDFEAYRTALLASVEGGRKTEIRMWTAYRETLRPLYRKTREGCGRLRVLNENVMYAARDAAGLRARKAIWSTALVAASALVSALVFSLVFADRIARPLGRLMEASRRISGGDYTVEVPKDTGDELGRLAGEFNEMARRLSAYRETDVDRLIAEKNKSEAILSSIEDGLVVFDPEGRVTALNPTARRLLALEFAETATLRLEDVLPEDPARDYVRRTLESGTRPDVPEERRILRLPAGDGEAIHCLYSVFAVRGRDRNLSGIVLLLRDVTRLKDLERLKEEFVMAASHELRTPLTSLGMSVELLRERAGPGLPDGDRELLATAHEEVQRMKALVSDLLDLSRMEAGRIEMEIESVSVRDMFERVESVFRNQAKMKDVRLRVLGPEGELRVRADPGKAAWVLTNLVSNALRYVEPGGHVDLFAQRIGPLAYLSVRDDGTGIPVESQARIFEKFTRIREGGTGGSGLGLAISKEIVRAHGGAIWVESPSGGRGSTFTFTLPAE